jgi:7-carboxy-7-deazaguanine synthase
VKDITTSTSFAQSEIRAGNLLPLMEDFYTIQGEGAHTGTPAYFIRIGGCDVGCHWCDVKESWNPDMHPPTSLEDIIKKIDSRAHTVVVTGGEPFTWNMDPLVNAIHNTGRKVHVETSGAYPLTGNWDWICLSPKKTAKVHSDFYQHSHELKVIVYNHHDFKWAEEHAALVGADCNLFLQPEWSRSDKMLPEIVEYVKNNPKWKVSLQTHKFMRIP